MITSLTGAYSALGTNDKLGALQAEDEINKAGGINGRKIDLTILDDQTKPDQAVTSYNKLVGDGVVAVIGSSYSGSSLAVIPVVDRDKIPYVSTAAADDQVTPVHAYVFMTPPTAATVGDRLLQYMKAKGLTKVAVLYNSANAFAELGWKSMKANAAKYGVDFIDQETNDFSTTNYTPQLTHVKASGAQALMVWDTGPGPVTVTKQFKDQGLGIPLIMSHAEASTLYAKPAGAAAENVIVATSLGVVGPYLPSANAASKVTAAMTKTFQTANKYYPPQFAFDGYNALELIADAIKRTGATASQIQQGLESSTLTTPEGTYRYSKTDHYGLGLADVVIARIKNGNFVPTAFSAALLKEGK
ncbi:MAG: ABC transporter substrate-binding protein [Chloroflexota bacterium]|nr:ABC transporter substrate-binding protein [Chloroflexota bacterium]